MGSSSSFGADSLNGAKHLSEWCSSKQEERLWREMNRIQRALMFRNYVICVLGQSQIGDHLQLGTPAG
jgi:hypothetical protein